MTEPTSHERVVIAATVEPLVAAIQVEQKVQNADISALEAKAPGQAPPVPAPAVATRTTTTVEDRPATSATTTTTATGADPPKPATTTRAEDDIAAGQRLINKVWEFTQAVMSILVTVAFLFAHLTGIQNTGVLDAAFFWMGGTYWTRTNHQKVGGVGGGQVGR